MNPLHVCWTCRLHVRLQTHLRLLQQARRGFSGSVLDKQEASTRPLRRTAPRQFEGFDDSSARIRSQHGSGIAASPSRGRYSNQPLQPEQLLTELDKPQRDGMRTPQLQRKRIEPDGRGSHALPPHLAQLVNQFIACGSAGERDAQAWSLLQLMAELEGKVKELESLGRHKWFMKAYMGFLTRCCDRVINDSGSSPMPSQVLSLLPVFNITATYLWAKTLWQVSSNIFGMQAKAASENDMRELPIEELMRLWNMCLASRLRRHDDTRITNVSSNAQLDWSFLPNPAALAKDLSMRQDDDEVEGAQSTFEHSLALLLPATGPRGIEQPTRQGGLRRRKPADHQSSILITLAVLRKAGGDDQYSPFVRLWEEILRVARAVEVPEALKYTLQTVEDDQRRRAYQAVVVEEFGLTYSEPVSKAPRHSFSAPNVNAEGKPIQKGVPHVDHGFLEEPNTLTSTEPAQLTSGGSPAVTENMISADDGSRHTESSIHIDTLEETQDNNTAPEVPDVLAPPVASLPSAVKMSDYVTNHFVTVRIKRLGQAIQKQNLGLAEHVKQEVLDFASDPSKPRLPDELYEHIMLTLLSLRSPQSAIQTWNHYIESGRQPTAKTYTVMMRGAQHVRDVKAVEAFWSRMRGAGVRPDVHAWSIRIFALIKAGRVDAGLKALGEISQEWLQAARAKHAANPGHFKPRPRQVIPDPSPVELLNAYQDDIDGVARPTLEVMNSAISALASRDDSQISKVIAWGRPFGLEPDRYTYNVLLNVAMRHGEGEGALAILKRMQERGIEADGTTWTVLLSALFEGRSLDGLSAEAQQERIVTFIDSLEMAASAGIDQKGYALVIDRLLKYYSNITAANAVLAQMTSKGVQPTAHIYTILMASYFQQQPQPDFAAAEALWSRIQASDAGRGAGLDSFFYDRIIEGYAAHHWTVGPEPMLRFLHNMAKTGKKPSWRAIDSVARALAAREDWNRLLQVVDHARRMMRDESAGEFMVSAQKRFGQRDFWRFIISTGLLREEGITSVEQMVGRGDGLSTLESAERRAALTA